MDKLSINIDPKEWGNLITKYQPHSPSLEATDFSEGTINLDTDTNGSLTKRKGGPNYNGTLLPAAPKDQFEAIFSDGARHLLVVSNGEIRYSTGDTVFNSVVNGTGFSAGANFEFATTQDRVYCDNGITAGQVYDRATSYGGVSYAAPRLKQIGAQVPVTAPTVAVAAGGSIPVGGHTYKITFLYYDAQESNGGPASAVATTSAGNQTINLSAIPVGGYGVTARNIYRDNNDGNWVFVAQISNNTATTFSDTISVSATPTPIPMNNGTPPIFKYITNWINRLWLSGIPGDPSILFYSEADQPDIYGSENQILCNPEDPITATIVYFDRLIVFNRHSMGQIIGSTPDTFRYAAIPSSIGCVDNRTLQIRALEGVPVLVWLSERGFYTYDGNSIEYISDVIENLVNFNIRQAIQQKNSNTQTSQTQFQSGTYTDGIDLTTFPGTIIQRGYTDGSSTVGNNPRRDWNDSGDWDDASTETNTKIYDGTNTLKNPRTVEWDVTQGTHSGTIVQAVPSDGNHVTLTQASSLGGETVTTGGTSNSNPSQALAMKFIPTVSGTVATGRLSGYSNPVFIYRVYSHDSANDRPNVSLGNVGSVSVTAGTTYWLVLDSSTSGNTLKTPGVFGTVSSLSAHKAMRKSGGTWFDINVSLSGTTGFSDSLYTITSTPLPQSGQWTSTIADSQSPNPIPATYYIKGSYPTNTAGTLFVEGSNDPFFGSILVTQSFANPNGFLGVSIGGARYWRSRLSLTTTNNLAVPSVGGFQTPNNTPSFVLEFSRTTTWVSQTIDTTGDSTVYNSLTTVASNFGGSVTTTVTTTIATSNIDSPAAWAVAPFVAFGSHVVRKYARIKVVLTAGQAGGSVPAFYLLSPIVTSITFSWTIVSTFTSVAIDTAVTPPAGWDVFLAQFSAGGGTVQFQFSSAPSVPQLGDGGHPFVTITPGNFPTNVAYQYAQWKVILTATDLAVPTVDSVTVQWFIANISSIRPASIFVDGRYYVSLAELNQDTNNLLLEIDLKGKWRRLKGISVSTFSYFFNRPYYGLSSTGQIRKFLEGYLDGTSNIEFDVRTKAFDFSTPYKDVGEKLKIVGELIIHAKNTGALLQLMYSVDEGENWYPFYTLSGASSYQTTTDGKDFFLRVKPSWSNGNPIAGQHLMYRIYNNDQYQVEVHTIKAQAIVRKGPPVVTG